jgi:hypothetical protein
MQTGTGATALAFSGGDGAHAFEEIRDALKVSLVEAAGLTVDFSDDIKQISAAILSHYRMLITHRLVRP